MKTKTLILSITKAFFILVFISCFYSCASTPIIDGNKPFIVNKIKFIDNGMCEYQGGSEARYNGNSYSRQPTIVLRSGLYNIGDTITWTK
jgi:hypothetical protein